MARNRIIYQSQALFIAPNSNQFHLQSGGANSKDAHAITLGSGEGWTGVTGVNVGSAKLQDIWRCS
jgi:hypothetical protein